MFPAVYAVCRHMSNHGGSSLKKLLPSHSFLQYCIICKYSLYQAYLMTSIFSFTLSILFIALYVRSEVWPKIQSQRAFHVAQWSFLPMYMIVPETSTPQHTSFFFQNKYMALWADDIEVSRGVNIDQTSMVFHQVMFVHSILNLVIFWNLVNVN